jgi:hypothetical protein
MGPLARAGLLGALLGALAGCRDGGSGEAPSGPPRAGLTGAVPSVTAPISVLSHPQTIIAANAALNNPTSVLPVHHYSSFDIGQKPSEFVEGAVFVGSEATSTTSGAVHLVQAIANTAASRIDYWPNSQSPIGTTILPVRGLAIDILEYDPGTRLNGYLAEERLLKGRLWVATGRFDAGEGRGVSKLHVLAGRGDAGRVAVELAQITPTAIDAGAGEFLTALAAVPPGIILFAASQTRVLRITPAFDESQSRLETFADLPAGAGGEAIFGLACDATGTLYVGRRGGSSFSITVFDAAAIAAPPASGATLALTFPAGAPVLASPTAISVNSADRLVVAERASGLFFEFDASGALVATLTARSATVQLPNPPATTGDAPTASTPTGPNQIATFACDPYLSRLVFATDPVPSGAGGASPGIRTLANVSFRGGIVPILENRCVFCHSSAAVLGGLDLEGDPAAVRARLLGRACETFDPADPLRPAECPPLPVQNPFFRTDIPVSPGIADSVFTTPGGTCPECPFPEPLARVEPGSVTRSYAIRKFLIVYAAANFSLVYFPQDLSLPIFTNNCAANVNGVLEAGEVCGERCPQASFVQRPLRRAEVDMLEEWVRRGALDD